MPKNRPADTGSLAEQLGALLDAFYGLPDSGTDWRRAFEGEDLLLAVNCGSASPVVSTVTYLADGTRQLAPPRPFDSRQCIANLQRALRQQERSEDETPRSEP